MDTPMIIRIVIQCAAAKQSDGFLRMPDGRRVKFVAHPEQAPSSESSAFKLVRPDDAIEPGARTWRDLVLEYNLEDKNPQGLVQAQSLYTPPAYAALVRKFGVTSIYVLSAGWGLIPATFMTPNYDITFSASADAFKRRRRTDAYRDFHALGGTTEPIVFLGGKDYLPLFCALTSQAKAPRVVYFNSAVEPDAPGCEMRRYPTSQRTNWHYSCAEDLINGTLELPWPT